MLLVNRCERDCRASVYIYIARARTHPRACCEGVVYVLGKNEMDTTHRNKEVRCVCVCEPARRRCRRCGCGTLSTNSPAAVLDRCVGASRHPWARCAARGVRSTRTPLRGVGPVVWGGSASPFDLVPGRAARARARAAAWRTWVRDACRVSRTVRRVPPPAGRRVSAARFSQTVQGPAVRGWRWQVPFAPARTATRTRPPR